MYRQVLILIISIYFMAFASTAYGHKLHQRQIELFDLPLKQLLKLEVNVSTEAVQNISQALVPFTQNFSASTARQMPATLEIVDRKTMEARGLENVIDVIQSMTGVTAGDTPGEPYSFSIRGFDRASVNVLYDGISIGISNLNMRPMGTNNLERVEVFKGPVVMTDEGTAGGTVNIISRRPALNNKHHIRNASATVGDYDEKGVSFSSIGPLTSKAGYTVAGEHKQNDGWVDNSDSEFTSLSGAVTWSLSPKVNILIQGDIFKDKLPAYWGTPLLPADVATKPMRGVLKTEQGWVIDESTRFTSYNVADKKITSESYWLKGAVEWSLSKTAELKTRVYHFSADREWQNSELYLFNETQNALDRDRLAVFHDAQLFGVDTILNLHSHIGESNLDTALGAEYRRAKFFRSVGFDLDNYFVDSVDIYNPVAGSFDQGDISLRDDFFNKDTLAIFASFELNMNKQWRFDGKLRIQNVQYDHERFNFDGSPALVQKGDLTHLSYNSGVSYFFNENAALYVQTSLQHDSLYPALREYESESLNSFRPADVRQNEIGFKVQSTNELLELNLALFNIDKKNVQAVNGDFRLNHRGSSGFETTVTNYFSTQLKLGLSLAVLNAKYKSYFNSDVDVSGNKPFNVPQKTGSLWLSYDKLGGLPIEIAANVTYVSQRFGNSENTLILDEYTLFNGFIAYTGKNYRLALHAKNIGDEVYVPFVEPVYPDQVILGPPRTVDLSLSYAF